MTFTAKPVIQRVGNLRLHAEDFETLEVIGRGAFGEVKVHVMYMDLQNFCVTVLILCILGGEIERYRESFCPQDPQQVGNAQATPGDYGSYSYNYLGNPALVFLLYFKVAIKGFCNLNSLMVYV